MTFVVAFDGSPLAEVALRRATEFADLAAESVVAVAVVPDSARYARERGWLADDENFEVDAVADRLAEQVAAVAPAATFRWERLGTTAPGPIASRIRRVARDEGASVVFIGSENAGRLVIPIASVGGAVASDAAYDVHVVRHASTSDANGSNS